MSDLEHVGYSKGVIEFVSVAKEYCIFVENGVKEGRVQFLSKLQRFIPLLYLKGSLLPECESENIGLIEEVVTEESYTALFFGIREMLGEYDEYLEVFDENMQYSEAPIVHSIAEKVCDIYQDLKNFVSAYQYGMVDVIEGALWQVNNSFELYWGKACASVLRAVHVAIFRVADE